MSVPTAICAARPARSRRCESVYTVVNSTVFNEIHKALDDGVQDVAERANLKTLRRS